MSDSKPARPIDADGHVIEDEAAIAKFLPKAYRDHYDAGRLSMLFPPLDLYHNCLPITIRGHHDRTGPVGPVEWLEFLDQVGIERTVLYPTLALSHGKIRDREWATAVARAYNEWLAETYTSTDEKFEGMAVIPLQSGEDAVTELRYAVEKLGLRGAVIPANGLGRNLGDIAYWPVYETAADLGVGVSVHGGAHDNLGFDDFNVYAPVHGMGHSMGQLISLAAFTFTGLFEKYPKLRVAFLEGGVAWLLMALERFEESYETHIPVSEKGLAFNIPGDDVSDYLKDLLRAGRIFLGFEGGEPDAAYVAKKLKMSPFMYSSDFPHEVDAESCIHELKEFDEDFEDPIVRQASLRTNAERFYQFS